MATLNQVQDVKKILGYGARKNLFTFDLVLPSVLGLSDVENQINLQNVTAFLPGTRVIEEEVIKYKGEVFKLAKEKGEYPGDLKISFRSPQNFAERNAFELWTNMIQTDFTSQRTSPTIYKSVCTVTHLDNRLENNRAYKFNGVWPKSVNAIELSAEEGGFAMVEVTFVFDNFELVVI